MPDDNIKVEPQALGRCAKALKEQAGPVGSAADNLPSDYQNDGLGQGVLDGAETLRAAVAKLLTALKTDTATLKSMLEDSERALDDASRKYSSTSDKIGDDAKTVNSSVSDSGE
ncbi:MULTISPECIES: hypothetical protein [Amycolatopsis]|uniref:ESX-1 secretion-associated protein n=1 Tax=Amycolatopsis albidoflavus TaxID=102226 RepID=A0ABW5I7R1_9PSEU